MKIFKAALYSFTAILLLVYIQNIAISLSSRVIQVKPGEKAYYCPNYGMYKSGESVDDICGIWKNNVPDLYKSCIKEEYKGFLESIKANKCSKVVVKTHTFNNTKCYVSTVPDLFPSKGLSYDCKGPDAKNAINKLKMMYK